MSVLTNEDERVLSRALQFFDEALEDGACIDPDSRVDKLRSARKNTALGLMELSLVNGGEGEIIYVDLSNLSDAEVGLLAYETALTVEEFLDTCKQGDA